MPATIDKKGSKSDVDVLVQGVSRLNASDFDSFFVKLYQTLTPQKKITDLENEAVLLKQIKELVQASLMRQYKKLQTKVSNQTITDKEHADLMLMSEIISEKNVEKVNLMVALAKIRKVPVSEVAKQLNSYFKFARNFHG